VKNSFFGVFFFGMDPPPAPPPPPPPQAVVHVFSCTVSFISTTKLFARVQTVQSFFSFWPGFVSSDISVIPFLPSTCPLKVGFTLHFRRKCGVPPFPPTFFPPLALRRPAPANTGGGSLDAAPGGPLIKSLAQSKANLRGCIPLYRIFLSLCFCF